jgi:hypothetical protein
MAKAGLHCGSPRFSDDLDLSPIAPIPTETFVCLVETLRSELYFGYTLEQGLYLAEPEKALLDELYLLKRGKASLELSELRLADISQEKLLSYTDRFPPYVQKAVHKLIAEKYT